MAFDPTKPINGSLITASELRSQFTGLKDEIDLLPTQAQLANDLSNTANAAVLTTLPQTSANSNAVNTLGQSADSGYNQSQMDTLLQKVDELINALRR